MEIDSSLIPGNSYPKNVRITLRGDNRIFHLDENDIEAHLDLSKYTEPGTYKIPVQIQQKGSAEETENMEIIVDPMELTLELDTRMSKTIPLTLRTRGYPEPGYEMVSYTLEPNQVVINGPRKMIEKISELSTEFIDLQGRNEDFAVRVRIINTNQLVIIRGSGTADFNGFIKELIVIKIFDDCPIQVRNLDESLEAMLNPPLASVKIHGVQSKLDDIGEGRPLIIVDCGGIREPGIYELLPIIAAEEELIVERWEPETIKVEIRRKQ
jgi:YbbR domain-containing protein